MGKTPHAPELVVELQQLIAGVAKNFLHRAYGTDGLPWGTKLSDLEDLVTALGQAVSQQMLDQALAAQAQQVPPEAQQCPGCGDPVEMEQPQPRYVQTGVGEAQWNEPGGYCTRCRRAFFPQSGSLGIEPTSHHSPGILQKMVFAGAHHPSFASAAVALEKLAGLPVPTKTLERLTQRIGTGRCRQREEHAQAYHALPRPLPSVKGLPRGWSLPR